MDFAIHGITQTEMEPRGKCRVFKAANIYNTDVDGWAMDGGTEGVAQTKVSGGKLQWQSSTCRLTFLFFIYR